MQHKHMLDIYCQMDFGGGEKKTEGNLVFCAIVLGETTANAEENESKTYREKVRYCAHTYSDHIQVSASTRAQSLCNEAANWMCENRATKQQLF